jgi:hypothetical protein
MAKGAEAKEYVAKKLKEVFGDDYVGEVDKKYYVWAYEGGQKMQIAIAMTCPKTPVGNIIEEKKEAFDWSDSGNESAPSTFKPIEIEDSEREKVAELMRKLGL